MIKHMNAKTLVDKNGFKWSKISPGDLLEEKLKGNRAFLNISDTGYATLWTRGGHNKTDWCPQICEQTFSRTVWGTILDGELYDPEMDDSVLAGHLHRNETPAPDTIGFYAFDVVRSQYMDTTGLPLVERKILLRQIIGCMGWRIVEVPYLVLEDIDHAKRIYNKIVDGGGEGIMLKKNLSLYAEGKRPENVWYKWKKYETLDVIVTGFTEAKEGKFDGLIGAIECSAYIHGSLCKVANVSGIDDALRKDITARPDKYLNMVMEIGFHVRTKDNSVKEPRFLGFRYDKTSKECVW